MPPISSEVVCVLLTPAFFTEPPQERSELQSMLLGELLLGQLARAVQRNPLRSFFCVAMALTLRGDNFHVASFSSTISIVQMYPA